MLCKAVVSLTYFTYFSKYFIARGWPCLAASLNHLNASLESISTPLSIKVAYT